MNAVAIIVQCPCGRAAELVTGVEVYPDRLDLREKPFWRCLPCRSHVGCHPGTTRPLGRLANMRLRKLRMLVHDALDVHWKRRGGKRGKVRHLRGKTYRRLATDMQLTDEQCHVGLFDEVQCEQAIRIIHSWGVPE